NKMLEGAAVAFETLGMSASDTQKHLADLKALALKTPFNFQDILKGSLTLNAFGFSIQSRIKDMKALSDAAAIAAAGNGRFAETFESIIVNLGQMRGKGKMASDEMNEIALRGVPVWDIFAKKVGKTVEETHKLVESGKLSGAAGSKFLIEAMGEFAAG